MKVCDQKASGGQRSSANRRANTTNVSRSINARAGLVEQGLYACVRHRSDLRKAADAGGCQPLGRREGPARRTARLPQGLTVARHGGPLTEAHDELPHFSRRRRIGAIRRPGPRNAPRCGCRLIEKSIEVLHHSGGNNSRGAPESGCGESAPSTPRVSPPRQGAPDPARHCVLVTLRWAFMGVIPR
jgi:hypothetical protein